MSTPRITVARSDPTLDRYWLEEKHGHRVALRGAITYVDDT
jgi:hypothetical protein